jgi:hypothetical protein
MLNPNDAYWSHPKMVADYEHGRGKWATNHRLHGVIHEYGHLAHAVSAPAQYDGLVGQSLSPDQAVTAAKVSTYATTDAREFVAETFTILALRRRRKLDADVLALYKLFGGPTL